jgi:hypothetical protein
MLTIYCLGLFVWGANFGAVMFKRPIRYVDISISVLASLYLVFAVIGRAAQ